MKGKVVAEKSVNYDVIDDLSAIFKITIFAIAKNEKSPTVFRSTLTINASIE
jgi:Tfp pilus assembly protein PilX